MIVLKRDEVEQTKTFAIDLTKAAATYTVCTAKGDVLIHPSKSTIYVDTAGGTFTSVELKSSQTTKFPLLTAVEGGVANIVAQGTVAHAATGSFILKDGQKIQQVMVGPTGTGAMTLALTFKALTKSATLV